MVIGPYQRLIAPGPSAGVTSRLVEEHIAAAAMPTWSWTWVVEIRAAEVTSSRAEACMRSDIEGAAWRAIPVRIGIGAGRVLNTGQLIRSIVLAAAVLVAAVTIALEPPRHAAGDSAPNDRTAWDRSRAAVSFIFPDERMALDQPGAAALADRARHAN